MGVVKQMDIGPVVRSAVRVAGGDVVVLLSELLPAVERNEQARHARTHDDGDWACCPGFCMPLK